jgi:hypothetical protein
VVLEAVLTKVESIDLKLCPSKCLFGANKMEHLGHLIAHNLLLPAAKIVRAIRDWIEPINVAEVRSFLGLAGYYRHFVRDFAKIAKPLHGLTREHATFTWGEHEKLSMELLKDALCRMQGLTRPDFNKPFLLDTDYSRIGIGATLSQVNEAQEERPIAFASRALHGAEANYSTTDGELLALVWAITVRFRSYLYGGPTFVARVDHNPLVWLHQQVNLQGRLARWHIRLMEFNFTVEHRAGRAHSNVDPLSRNPVAALPWEIKAGELDDFPESAALEFETRAPPTHPTVRMASIVDEDVDSSEGIGNGAVIDAEPRTPEEETSHHSETPVDAPSKAQEGIPIMRQGRRLHPKRLFSRGGQQGKEYPRSMGCKWCTFGNFGPLTTWRNGEVADALPEEPTEYGHSLLLAALLELGYLEEIQKGLFARGGLFSARGQEQNRLSALALECRTWAREEEYLQLMLKDNQQYRCQDEDRDVFWDLSVELVESNRHSKEGCKLHHHFVWTHTDEEDNEQPRGLTVRMIRSPTELPGPPALDIEEDARDAQEEPAPVGANEVLGDNWDDHLGWDADANIAAAEAAAPAEDVLTDPRISRGLEESELLNAVHEMKRQVRFKSNGGEEPTLAAPSLVERVAIAILHDRPEKAAEEVLREVKRSVLNLRLEYRKNVERALKESLAMQEEKQDESGEGIPLETHLDAFELTPTPEPQDYLVDDDEVITYLFKGELPAFADLSTRKREKARRQIRD